MNEMRERFGSKDLSSRRTSTLDQLEQLQNELTELRRAALTFTGRPEAKEGDSTRDRADAKKIVEDLIRLRRSREVFFGSELFAEPAWDLLLELYHAELSYARLSVSKACKAAAVPSATALRWLAKLCDCGFVQRSGDPHDARRSWVDLSTEGSEKMRQLIEQTGRRRS